MKNKKINSSKLKNKKSKLLRPLSINYYLLIILIFGAILRISLFSGYGLGDDTNYLSSFMNIFSKHMLINWHIYYQFSLWIPILVLFTLFGVSEYTFILSITISSVASIFIVYKILDKLYSKEAGLIGALLMSIYPFEITFSTLFVPDIPLTMLMGVSFYFFVSAEKENYSKKQFLISGFFLFLAVYTKITALFLIPVYLLIILLNLKEWKKYTLFFMSFTVLIFFSMLITHYLVGDFFGYYNALKKASTLAPITLKVLLRYPNQLFNLHPYGMLIHGVHFHISVICTMLFLASFMTKNKFICSLRKSEKVFIYVLVIFLLMEFLPHAYQDGQFTSTNRIERYAAIMGLPCVLFISFFVWQLYLKRLRLFYVFITMLVIFSVYEAYKSSSVTIDSFSDCKDAADFIKEMPQKYIWSDYMMSSYLGRIAYADTGWGNIKVVKSPIKARQEELDFIESGYVITGGSRLPSLYYGCDRCINKLEAIKIPKNWKLIKIFEKDLRPWRTEVMKIWEVYNPKICNTLDYVISYNDCINTTLNLHIR